MGLVAEMFKYDMSKELGGTLQQGVQSCRAVLDKFLAQSDTIVSSMVVAEKRTSAAIGKSVVDVVANILGMMIFQLTLSIG